MPVVLLLVMAAVVELVVLVAVGNAIGLLPTILLLVAASVLGSWLVRHEGRRALAALGDALRARRVPRAELTDGVLVAAGGLLILLPGFVSDAAGLLLLAPPTRALLRRRLLRRVPQSARYGTGPVVEGMVVDADARREPASAPPELR